MATSYRPDITGLRGIAVLLVIAYHAGWTLFTGGFVGVDVFFTISGFVVTTMVLEDLRRGRFSLVQFYARRAKRLAPSLYLVLFALLVFGWFYLSPKPFQSLATDLKYAVGLIANVRVANQTGYFDPASVDQPLLHLWSLALEEQFYLLLPAIVLISARARGGISLRALALAIAGIGLASLLFSEYSGRTAAWGLESKIARGAFYYLPSRAFELLLGVWLALLLFDTGKLPPQPASARLSFARDLLFMAGVVGVISCGIFMAPSASFPGFAALLPIGLTATILYAGAAPHGRFAWMLANPVLEYVGKISYVLYLWHWVVLYAVRTLIGTFDTPAVIASLIISLVLAAITHAFVEKPFRYVGWSPRRTFMAFMALPIVLVLSFGWMSKQSNGFAGRLNAEQAQIYGAISDTPFAMPVAKQCHFPRAPDLPPESCRSGDPEVQVNAVLWGDSHAWQMVDFMDGLGQAYALNVRNITYGGCGPLLGWEPGQRPSGCIARNAMTMEFLRANPQIRYVFLAAMEHNWTMYPAELEATIAELSRAGKRVVIIGDVPLQPLELTDCQFMRSMTSWYRAPSDCGYPATYLTEQRLGVDAVLVALRRAYPDLRTFTLHDVLCSEDRCATSVAGQPVYALADRGHLNSHGAQIYYSLFAKLHRDELVGALGEPETRRLTTQGEAVGRDAGLP